MKNLSLCFPEASTSLGDSLDNDKQTNANEQPVASYQDTKTSTAPPSSAGGGEVKLRDRRRRESAPVIGMSDLDQAHPAGSQSQQVRGARRVSKGSQRAMLVSCLSEDSALEGLESIGDINTPKGSRRNFIELMMSSSPQVGHFCILTQVYKTAEKNAVSELKPCQTLSHTRTRYSPAGASPLRVLHILNGSQLPSTQVSLYWLL